MELKFQERIDNIEDCPAINENGDKTLYRFILSVPMDSNSFKPHSLIHKPKFDNICIAWGLSTYDSFKSAKEALQNLPKKTREKFTAIAVSDISDDDGVKYPTKNKRHYTFFPKKEVDLLAKFALVKEDE
ncbi:hypothetical protein DET49_104121 [Salegentibacter sp. 24]|uniref:hypothetical protein n=1 Tax=Salegentibacter sp. 24 TaxID=2183986 RepID=UPI00105C97B6|nr:hypothetical protein [Salegentibacter sp. 24]TDN93395.1 hypothetical protein DET49_104121 [Salegentibacter sp. 24]